MNIKFEKFEGPLSLLLKMIEMEELDITEVSLAQIADQYVDFIRNDENIDPDHMTDFLIVAARLLYLKSRALLPYLVLDDEEEENIEELEKQLKMYKEFLLASEKIEEILKKENIMFAREFNRKVALFASKFSPPKNLSSKDMANVFEELLVRIKPAEKMKEEIIERKVSMEEKILHIQKVILNKIKTSFDKIVSSNASKSEIVVSFLAALELMRQKEIVLSQEGLFGEIKIQKAE